MASITWEWVDYWAWLEQIEDDNVKAQAMREVNKDNWVARLSAKNQADVFRHAPEEVLLSLKHLPNIVKRDCLVILENERILANKKRRGRRL